MTFRPQRAIPCAEPYLGLPANGLDRFGELLPTPVPVPTDLGRVPVGPGTCDQGPTGRGMPSFGHAARLTPSPTGIGRGGEPQRMHEWSGILEARQVAEGGDHGHGHRALDTPQSLEGLDHGGQAPGLHLFVECECETPQTFRLCRDGLDIFLTDHGRRWGRTDDLAEPAQGGRAPVSSPRIADSMAEHEGLEPPLGRLQLPQGLFPRPVPGAERFIVDGGDVDRGRAPARMSRASGLAARRAVLTRSPAF